MQTIPENKVKNITFLQNLSEKNNNKDQTNKSLNFIRRQLKIKENKDKKIKMK